MSKLILWFEDQPDDTTQYAKLLQDNFELCSTGWSLGPAHTISSGLRYLLEAAFGNSGCRLPDLILLDSKLAGDVLGNNNKPEILKLCGTNKALKDDVNECLAEATGGAVLRFLGRHIYQFFPHIRVVYLSQYGESEIRKDHGGEVLADFPGLLSGYYSKKDGPPKLCSMLFDILQDDRRGYSFAEIRNALPEVDRDYLLGPESDAFEWSDAYRLALTDLIEAGEDKAWPYEGTKNKSSEKPYVTFLEQRFKLVLDSHKQLPRALLLAERGCGKEGFARALHRMWYSRAGEAPFVSVNIGGVPPWSAGIALQLRLFGGQQHANQTPEHGCVPQAWNGTLLLDELGDTQKDVQDTLLRLIQEGEYEPALWQRQVWAAHCCFIGATNRDLWSETSFRADLADRLAMHVIRIPPIKEVKSDIALWMIKIARETAAKLQPFASPQVPSRFEFPDVAANMMQGYSWPGNLREMTHLIRRMQLSSLGKAHIPLGVVTKELSRLKGSTVYDETIQVGLPNSREQLDALFEKFANYMRSQGKHTFTKSELYRYVTRIMGTHVTSYKFEKHLENRFDIRKDQIPDILQNLAETAGGTVWGHRTQT